MTKRSHRTTSLRPGLPENGIVQGGLLSVTIRSDAEIVTLSHGPSSADAGIPTSLGRFHLRLQL